MKYNQTIATQVLLTVIATLIIPLSLKGSYYTEKPIFLPYPNEGKTWDIRELGPIGIGIQLVDPAFTMKVTGVTKGSPADKSGKIKKGQIIESINGRKLEKTDPRVILGDIITEAEATDGKIELQIKGEGTITFNIPVLGRYSDTWPVNCPKSDKIIENLADLIAAQEKPIWGSLLFLLSTGEDKYMPVVKKWAQTMKFNDESYPWHMGMGGLGLCEYYLRTGDSSVLPTIEAGAEQLKKLMYAGGWSGRGHAQFTYSVGSGQLNAAGVPAGTYLMLAKLCGVKVDEYTLHESLKNFYRYAGHDNVGYGNNWPEGGFRDNGKTSALAFMMQGAARLDPEGEESIYAKARDISSVKAFYANPWFNRGHTGGGIGEMWHGMAIGFMADKRPDHYRNYMDARRWHFELSRSFDGAIGINDGARYDTSANRGSHGWGTFYALAYTMPRKKLVLFGAPLTRWAKPYDLPERPWGTAADEAFLSLQPAALPNGKIPDLSNERLGTHCSWGYSQQKSAADVTDDKMMELVHHIDHGIRSSAAGGIVSQGRANLLVPMLKSKDPRVRHAGLQTIAGIYKGKPFEMSDVSPEAMQIVGTLLEDPNESLWVRLHAAKALARADAKTIGKHKETLLTLLEHDDWWVGSSAGQALSVIIAEPDHYQEVIPAMAKFCAEIEVANLIWPFIYEKSTMMKNLMAAPENIRDYAAEEFAKGHAMVPAVMQAKGGHIVPNGAGLVKEWYGKGVAKLYGKEPMPATLSFATLKYRKSLNESDLVRYDGRFVSDSNIVGTWEYVAAVGSPSSLSEAVGGKPADDKKKTSKKKGKGKPKPMTFEANGTIKGRPDAVWTKGMFFDLLKKEACEMITQTHDGETYLLIQKGAFDAKGGQMEPEWNPGYNVYRKGS